MDHTQLIQNIVGNTPGEISEILYSWVASSERFANFVKQYQGRIQKRIQKAGSIENIEALIFELEIPYLLLLDNRFEVEYEKYKSENGRSPDFFVQFEDSAIFNLEVKLIREPDLGERFEMWLSDICGKIETINSDVGFAFDMFSTPATSEFMERLESACTEIAGFIENMIMTEGGRLPVRTTKEFPIPGFEEEDVLLILSMPPHNEDHKVYYAGGGHPIFYTQKELNIFGDTICDKIQQLLYPPNMINLLVIRTNSSTHEWRNLLEAVNSINTLLSEANNAFFIRKGYEGVQDFIKKSKNLSGVLFRSCWLDPHYERNRLWLNNQAFQQIPEPIQEYLENMQNIRT